MVKVMPTNHTLDFWTVAVPLSEDEKDVLVKRLTTYEATFNDSVLGEDEGKRTGFRVDYAGRQDWRNNPIWYVSIWGSGALCMLFNLSDLQRIPSRSDFRIEFMALGGTDKFRKWRDETLLEASTKRNVNAFNTRDRKKTGERDRGGLGIAFGSMKSQRRLTAYKASSSPYPVVEVQFRGKKANTTGYELLKLIELHETAEFALFSRMYKEWVEDNIYDVVSEFLHKTPLQLFDAWSASQDVLVDEFYYDDEPDY